MRTYDKLIATIFAHQVAGGLRSFPGVPIAAANAVSMSCAALQEAG